MLERILNIGPDMSPKSGRTNSYENYVKKPQISKVFGNDSIIFSPAAIYLSKINWVPKDINILSDEKLYLHFFYSEFEFSTLIDFGFFYKETVHSLNIYKQYLDDKNKRHKSLLKVEFKKEKINLDEEPEKNTLDALGILFERIIDLNIANEINRQDVPVIDKLLESIDNKLLLELNYIFTIILTFISKLGRFNIINGFEFPATYDENIKIDRIVTIDA